MAIRPSGKLRRNSSKSVLNAQRKQGRHLKRSLLLENLEDRRMMAVGPTLVSIQQNDTQILNANQTYSIAPRELTFNFANEQDLALKLTTVVGTATTPSAIQVRAAGGDGDFANGSIAVTPGFIGIGDTPNQVVLRFASPLPDDTYRITISSALQDISSNPYNSGVTTTTDFNLDLGAQVLAVVPQPVSSGPNGLVQRASDIDVYFNSDTLSKQSAEIVNFYKLIITGNTVSPTDDVVLTPSSVVYNAAQNKATLTFNQPLQNLNPNNFALRLKIGTNEGIDTTSYTAVVPGNDSGSSYAAARSIGPLSGKIVYSEQISAKPYNIAFPGGSNDPGHRDVPSGGPVNPNTGRVPLASEEHLLNGADGTNGVGTRFYNFKNVLGSIPDGRGGFQTAFNVITPAQKQRAREILELYSRYSGIQFVESQQSGLTIATGDLRIADPDIPSGVGGVAGLGGGNIAVMDSAEPWTDGYGESWFGVALHEIGHALGLGHSYDLPLPTSNGEDPALSTSNVEGVYPGDASIVHMQHMYRPEGQDIDMYQFRLATSGTLTAETFAERLQNRLAGGDIANALDTYLRLYRDTPNGPELVAINDDYFSKDSKLELHLSAGNYFIGVSSKGNDQYDPSVPDSGLGGLTEGAYKLDLNFRADVTAANAIVDLTGTVLDGDADGVAGGTFNFWFKTAGAQITTAAPDSTHTVPTTLFVDRSAAPGGNGSLARPFDEIDKALLAANVAGDIVRIVGNNTSLAYDIGFNTSGTALRDGSSLIVPKNVTVMVDAGAEFRMRRGGIQVGSAQLSAATDRSGGAFQVLGTPQQSVNFTSFNATKAASDWGGIVIRNDKDRADGRFDWEEQGIFLNSINFANIQYGGGTVNLAGVQSVIDPITLVDARATITNNTITNNANMAVSATPNSFAETNFREPRYQPDGTYATSFNVDYGRVGPEIHGNVITLNSFNGIFIRTNTPAAGTLQKLTVPGRFNDTDIVHVISENLIVAGSPTGSYFEEDEPQTQLVTLTETGGGNLTAGTYRYRIVYVDQFGNEGRASDVLQFNVTGASQRSIRFDQLSQLPIGSNFVGRRIYRANASNVFVYVDQIPASATTFTDRGAAPAFDRILNPALLNGANGESFPVLRGRPDASLKIDPNIVVKLNKARIELEFGATMIAEGLDGQEVVFTSLADDRYGAGGTFDTNKSRPASGADPVVGVEAQWAGIYAGPNSLLSIDQASIFYAGGVANVEGDVATFNAVEIQQADARIANTLFQFNGNGLGGTAPASRFGRGTNATASIFIRGSQPVIENNIIRDNLGAAMNIDVNALNSTLVVDRGRQSGPVKSQSSDRIGIDYDNNGPLIVGNRLDNNGPVDDEGWNGMIVRGGVLTTEGVWDDTDIAHVIHDEVRVTDQHTYGGLRFESAANESLVVKGLSLNGNISSITVGGRPLEIDDRIGGRVQVLGQPGFPVIFTSYRDDSASAGLTPDGAPMGDTNNDGQLLTVTNAPFADVVVIMDESGSMSFAQTFSAQFIQDLDAGLLAAGIGGATGPNRYGLFGYGGGGSIDAGHVIPLSGPNPTDVWGTAAQYVQGTTQLVVSGATEEGYGAIERMIPLYPTRSNAAKFVILVTNEDRDIVDANFTFQTTLASLQNAGYALQGILNVDIEDATGQTALALDPLGNAYVDDLAGSFTVSPNGRFLPGFDTSVPDYGNLVHATGGIAGDIDSISNSQQQAQLFSQILVGSIVAQAGGGRRAGAGDWQGILIDKYAHDRNVDTTLEQETTPGENDTHIRSQQLGFLASHEKGGDENLRLGFTVHGELSVVNDHDVYGFRGQAGTQIWIDLDRTTSALDTIVELIDSAGAVIARSDDSLLEETNGATLFGDAKSMTARPGTPFGGRDFYTTNARDAGLRVVLPGPAGETSQYFVRVRSKGASATVGNTSGAYQLQIRLREADEIGGTTVRYADIRFAENGIELRGQPIHSPLAGEHREASGDNNSFGGAQIIGNVLNVDRGASSIAGTLSSATDVDWYRFDLDITQIQQGSELLHSLMFDLDYADGLGEANTILSVFDNQGRLILSNRDSSVADDQPAPLSALKVEDLLRGSVGEADAFVGPIYLPAGGSGVTRTYFVAISSDAQVPSQWAQYFSQAPANALVRFQPLDSVQRIAEDHINEPNPRGTRALADVQTVLDPNSAAVPFHLGDVSLFLQTGGSLRTADPFTGAQETIVTDGNNQANTFLRDIAFRDDENLFGFTIGNNDGDSGNFVQLDTGNGAVVSRVDDEITTFRLVPQSDGTNELEVLNVGVQFEALTFGSFLGGAPDELLAVGNRIQADATSPRRNLVYQFSDQGTVPQNDGPVDVNPIDPPGWVGALTSAYEVGSIDTTVANGGLNGLVTGLAQLNGQLYAVDNAGGLYQVDANLAANLAIPGNSPAKVNQVQTAYIGSSRFELEGLQFAGLTAGPQDVENGRYADLLFAVTTAGRLYAFDVNGILQPIFENGATSIQLAAGGNVTGLAFSHLDENLWHVTEFDDEADNIANERQLDPGHGMPITFNESVQPVGTEPFRMETTTGHSSFYFGDPRFEQNFNGSKVRSTGPTSARGSYDAAGGAYGTIVSNEFSLKGYSSSDLPTLYYNYFLNSEERYNSNNDNNQDADSIRVFIAGDDGNWQLVAGDSREDYLTRRDAIPANETSTVAGHRMWEGDNDWRQVRINLGEFAGRENLRLRFDFSTAADMNLGNIGTTGTEIRAVKGSLITDGDYFTVDNQRFEFDSGVTIITSPGQQITDGDTFTVRFNNTQQTFEFNNNGVINGPTVGPSAVVVVPFTTSDTANDIATSVRNVISSRFLALTARLDGNRVNLDGLDNPATDDMFESSTGLSLEGAIGTASAQSIRLQVHADMTRGEVADVLHAALEPFLSSETLLVQGTQADYNDGQQFTISAGGQNYTFELDKNDSGYVPAADKYRVDISDAVTANDVAVLVRAAMNAAFTGSGRTATYVNSPATVKPAIVLQGNRTERFTSSATSQRFRFVSSDNQSQSIVKRDGDLIRIINHTIMVDANTGTALGIDNALEGDVAGGFENNDRGQNNNFEGVYIDDIIIGLAERGEIVTGAAADATGFIANAGMEPNQNISGTYQLEIRRGPDYGFPGTSGPTFNSNARLNESVTIFAPSGAEIADGATFTISDTINQVTFEFDAGATASIVQGRIRIPFNASDTAETIAKAMRTAINSAAVQFVLKASAQIGDGNQSGASSTSNRVNIIGGSAFVLAGSFLGARVVNNTHRYGDDNQFRDQGQLILEGNRISNSAQWGILVTTGERDSGSAPHAGPTRNLNTPNSFVVGPVIVNNVIYNNGAGGIRFSGSQNDPGQEVGSIPFGRIINNTLHGDTSGDVGIQVANNASPTLLNNIVSNFATGISVDATSQSAGTVNSYSLYKDNTADVAGTTVGTNALVLTATDTLFVDASTGNFYLRPDSPAVDSSTDSLEDRDILLNTVRSAGSEPYGIPPSPILAPERDVTGQFRSDDSGGGGSSTGGDPLKDRGAIERSDFALPLATIVNPVDNETNAPDPAANDIDPTVSVVSLGVVSLSTFEIQLTDDFGIGVDDSTVTAQTVRVEESTGGPYATLDIITDYDFRYDATNNKIILTPTSGVWAVGRNYRITLDNSVTDATPGAAIRDIAGNLLQGTRINGTVVFDVLLGTAIDYGDAPVSYGTLRANNGPSHRLRSSLRLGASASADSNGQPTPNANADSSDDGLTARVLRPGKASSITVTANGAGKLDAWLDWNKDGDFLDSGEHIVQGSTLLGNGTPETRNFTFSTQAGQTGDTFLRLRYSTAGSSLPSGMATDGEVEDYKVTMTGPEDQNPNNQFDVNVDGLVNTRDALLVVNLVNNFDTDNNGIVDPTTLPSSERAPNRYYDVNGDGDISRLDALLIVNFLNSQAPAIPAPANRAPVLDASLNPTVFTISEGATNPAGTLVSKLLANAVTDADANAKQGMAITGVTGSASGKWQFTTNGGATWVNLGSPSQTSARLLAANAQTRVRFLPTDKNFNGDVRLTYRAWDQTQGTAGGTFSAQGNLGGAKAFSVMSETAVQTVKPVNDAPVLNNTLNPRLNGTASGSTNPAGTFVKDLIAGAVSDADAAAKRGIAVTGAGGQNLGKWQFSVNGGTSWTLLGSPSDSAARLLKADSQTLVRFVPNPGFAGDVKLFYRAWDQTQGTAGGTLNTAGKRGGTNAFSTAFEHATLTVALPGAAVGGSSAMAASLIAPEQPKTTSTPKAPAVDAVFTSPTTAAPAKTTVTTTSTSGNQVATASGPTVAQKTANFEDLSDDFFSQF